MSRGWQQYFAELAQFLTHVNKNLGLADEDGSVNIVERLQVRNMSHSNWLHHNGYCTCCLKICVQSLTVIRQHLETITELRTIAQQFDIVIECCRQREH